jgi:hypothetical protein
MEHSGPLAALYAHMHSLELACGHTEPISRTHPDVATYSCMSCLKAWLAAHSEEWLDDFSKADSEEEEYWP